MGSAFPVFLNVTPAYINGVAYDGGTYRTVGTSFEFGGLVDGAAPSTKNELLVEILEFFDMNPLGILCEDGFESGDTSGWSMTDALEVCLELTRDLYRVPPIRWVAPLFIDASDGRFATWRPLFVVLMQCNNAKPGA